MVKRIEITSTGNQMRLHRSLFGCLTICILMTATAFAAEQTVKGTIKSVDVAKNSIMLDDLELDVSRKTKITVDGKKATLADVNVGQTAAIKYDDELDAAITIVVERTAEPSPKVKAGKATELSLLEKDSLDAWELSPAGETSQWTLTKGILKLNAAGPSLVTKEKFSDFDLHLEFKLPSKCNTGVFLRGRYEVQLLDSDFRNKEGKPAPPNGSSGAIYGQIAPSKNMYRGPDKWNSMDIRLIGKVVTIRLNDVVVIDSKTINAVTAGALDAFESEPGPLVLQAHGVIGQEFRNIRITPITDGNGEPEPAGSTGDQIANDGFQSLIAIGSLDGWYLKEEAKDGDPNWEVNKDELIYKNVGPSLISDNKYGDFEMRAEFKLPKDCNCGIFLRGRYEVKLTDTPKGSVTSLKPEGRIGAIFNRITPTKNAYKGTNQWNQLEVKLIGQTVTVKINGETVIDAQEIKGGPTGPALDKDEDTPGPFMMFAHPKGVGAKFRNIKVKPLVK